LHKTTTALLLTALSAVAGPTTAQEGPPAAAAGSSAVSEEQEQIRDVLNRFRIAMARRDAEFVREHYGEQVMIAERGVMFSVDRARAAADFENNELPYHSRWTDIKGPVIHLSDGEDWAWAFVFHERKRLSAKTEQLVGIEKTASLVVLRRAEDGWKIQAIADTRQGGLPPAEPSASPAAP